MTLTVWPTSVPFDPDDGTAQSSIESLFGSGAPLPLVVLVTGREARRDGWAARVAIVSAAAMAASGGRVILADASLDEPELHAPLGVENNEGLVDVFLFGASLRSVTHHAPGQSFEFLAAGSYTPDPGEVLRNPRWQKLIAGLANTGASMIVSVPSELPGCSALARRATALVMLATQDEEAAVGAGLPAECNIVAALRPAASTSFDEVAGIFDAPPVEEQEDLSFRRSAPPVVQQPAVPFVPEVAEEVPAASQRDASADVATRAEEPHEPAAAEPAAPERAAAKDAPRRVEPARNTREDPREALVEALWARRTGTNAQRSGGGGTPQVDPVPGRKLTDEEMLSQPVFVSREKPRKSRGWLPHIMWLVFGLLAGVGAIYGYLNYRGTRAVTPVAPAATAAGGAAAPVAPRPIVIDSLIPFAVAIAAEADVNEALDRIDKLRSAQPDIEFYASPSVNGGKIYYWVFAGPVADSVEAVDIVQRLLDAHIKTVVSPLNDDIVEASLAFKLGDFSSKRAAQDRVQELRIKKVPAYVTAISTPGGDTAYRVYSGAFNGSAEADILRPVLRTAGFPDSLTQRTGRTAS